MALDLIKSYLVGIGFNVDNNSLKNAQDSINSVGSKIKGFSENSNKGFSETSGSLKDLFSILNSGGTLGKLFPELEAPFKELLVKVALLKKLFKDINDTKINKKEVKVEEKSVKDKPLKPKNKDNPASNNVKVDKEVLPLNKKEVKVKEKLVDDKPPKPKNTDNHISKEKQDKEENTPVPSKKVNVKKAVPPTNKKNVKSEEKLVDDKPIKPSKDKLNSSQQVKENIKNETSELVNKASYLSEGLGNLKNTAKTLLSQGGGALKSFASSALGPIALVTTAISGTILAIKKLGSSLNDLANQDIHYEKLSRQLWTTKETAKEIDSALKSTGATMEDLWLSPTLLKQFNQLRKDSSRLKLPSEFQDNIKVVQGLGLEFKRLKQLASLLFQWIGNYIMKYLSDPLADAKDKMHSFNEWLIQNIPKIAEVIGTIMGFVLKLLINLGKLIGFIWKLTAPIRYIFSLLKKLGNSIKNAPEGVKVAVKAIIGILVLMFAPFLILIALVDDFFTFLRGGKSVIGDFFSGFKKFGSNAISKIHEKLSTLKKSFKDGMSNLKQGWDEYWERASKRLDDIKEKAKGILKDIKEWGQGIWDKGKDFASKMGKKVVEFVGGEDTGNSVANAPKSYVTNNSKKSSINTSNSNNKISNENTINVYGKDANTTASAVDKRLKSISMRNQQGVIG